MTKDIGLGLRKEETIEEASAAKTKGFIIKTCCKDVPSSPSRESTNASSSVAYCVVDHFETYQLEVKHATHLMSPIKKGGSLFFPNAFIALVL